MTLKYVYYFKVDLKKASIFHIIKKVCTFAVVFKKTAITVLLKLKYYLQWFLGKKPRALKMDSSIF